MAIWQTCVRPLLVAATVYAATGLANGAEVPCDAANGCRDYAGSASNPDGVVTGDPATARTNFDARLSSSATDGLTGYEVEIPVSSQALTFGTLSDANGYFRSNDCDLITELCNGRFNTTGASSGATVGTWWEAAYSFTIEFTSAVAAFGFFATDLGDFDGQLTVILTDTAGDTLTSDVTGRAAGDGSLNFFGVVDEQRRFTSVFFSITQTAVDSRQFDYIGFDDFVVGQVASTTPPDPSPIPLPGTALLASLGLGLITVARRRLR